MASTAPITVDQQQQDIVLTPKREHFAQLVAGGFTAADAYRTAFDTRTTRAETVHEAASRLLADGMVAARVDSLRAIAVARATEGFAVSRGRVLAEMYRLGTFDPRRALDADGRPLPLHELPDDVAAAVEAVEVQTDPEGRPIAWRYKFARKAPHIDQLAKVLGMYEADNRQRAGSLADALAQLAAASGSASPAPSPRIGPAPASEAA